MEMEHFINILYKHLKYPMENLRNQRSRMNIHSLVNLYQLVIQLYISIFVLIFVSFLDSEVQDTIFHLIISIKQEIRARFCVRLDFHYGFTRKEN